jgi:EAL domain-containing protein (putative c-di-GMP-specific phosphodiesterase class I)
VIERSTDEFYGEGQARPLAQLGAEAGSLDDLMRAVREHLGLQAAYASAAVGIERERHAAAALNSIRAPIDAVMANGSVQIVYQPIWKLGEARPIGFEALARFPSPSPTQPSRSPDQWFNDAAIVGLGEALEVLAVEKALVALLLLPEDIYITVNVSPLTAHGAALHQVLRRHDLKRIVLEITEHEGVEDVLALRDALAGLRAQGMRLAVDDAGAGYSGLQQILQLRPDVIKLDRFFVSGIDSDPSRRALAAALAEFSNQVGSTIIAEGVEVEAELETLRTLGFRLIQGYLLGKPQPLADALALVR